jgi:hypothetical protein
MECRMCFDSIRVSGGLKCVDCASVYHKECAGKWVDRCPTCSGHKIEKWTRPDPPGPTDEVIDAQDYHIDGNI